VVAGEGRDVCWSGVVGDGGQPDPEMEGGELHSTTPLPPSRLLLAGLAASSVVFYFIGHLDHPTLDLIMSFLQ
jgi:hypothetical protein